jgi:ABC-2 type transport system ATP-binding protein
MINSSDPHRAEAASDPAPAGTISVSGLTKAYGRRRVVDDVSFECPPGSITGFLGPNGSGKSTTLRMMIDHSARTAGRATFDGVEFRDLQNPGRHVGVLLDASAQHAGRTVWETVRLAALVLGVSRKRTTSCVNAVGLGTVLRKRVGNLSLGMRQRLGLAVAVLGSPHFLLLDEPANGLDPEGITWLRIFLRRFAEQGGTVLVSSHQLSEIEAVADQILVIDRGVLLEEHVLMSSETFPVTLAASEDDDALRRYLASSSISILSSEGESPLRIQADPLRIGRLAQDNHLALSHLSVEKASTLERRFLESTRGEHAALSSDDLLAHVGSERS